MLEQVVVGIIGLMILHFYTLRILTWKDWVPTFTRTLRSWRVSSRPVEKAEVLACMFKRRERVLKEIAAAWCPMIESFWLPYYVLVNYYAFGSLFQVPCFLSGAIAVPALQKVAQTNVKLTSSVMQQCTFFMSISILISSVGFPRDLMPILYVARIMVGMFSTDVWHVNNMNLLLAPLHVLSNWMQKEPKAEVLQFMFMIIAEVFFISITALILSTLHEKEYQLAVASLELEEKVQQVKEAERSGVAAQRLLAVTCDASARLTGALRISQPSPSLSDLLMCGFGSSSGCNHLEGVPFLRYVDASEHHRLKDFIEESAKASTPPRSIHLQMRDSSGISFNAELFHVAVPSLTSEEAEHLIGISQENSERALTTAEEQSAMGVNSASGSDMRHILGYGLPHAPRAPPKPSSVPSFRSKSLSASSGEARSEARSSSRDSRQNLIRLRMLQKVNFTVDMHSDDFMIKSVHLTFGQTEGCPKDALPKLLEWIKPNYRSLLNNWAQAHANAFASGNACKETASLRGIKLISPMQSAKTILAGEVTPAGFQEVADSTKSDSGSESAGGLLMNIEMSKLFAH